MSLSQWQWSKGTCFCNRKAFWTWLWNLRLWNVTLNSSSFLTNSAWSRTMSSSFSFSCCCRIWFSSLPGSCTQSTHKHDLKKKSQCALFKPSPPVWICSQVGGRKTAAFERWRCAFCAVVSLSSINFTWTSRHFPTTLCCQHPLCEAGGGEGGTEASRAAEEDRKAQEQNMASTNDRKELSPPKTTSLL